MNILKWGNGKTRSFLGSLLGTGEWQENEICVYKDFKELNSSSLWYCIHRKRHVVGLTEEETIFILMLKLFGILGLNSYWML